MTVVPTEKFETLGCCTVRFCANALPAELAASSVRMKQKRSTAVTPPSLGPIVCETSVQFAQATLILSILLILSNFFPEGSSVVADSQFRLQNVGIRRCFDASRERKISDRINKIHKILFENALPIESVAFVRFLGKKNMIAMSVLKSFGESFSVGSITRKNVCTIRVRAWDAEEHEPILRLNVKSRRLFQEVAAQCRV